MEYINKKWDLPTMEKRIENLKKVISPNMVDWIVQLNVNKTDSRLDGLYLAYYDLKDRFCKVKRKTFGEPKTVEFVPKKQETIWYNSYNFNTTDNWYTLYGNTTYDSTSITYTLSNTTAATTAATIDWNPNDYIWDVITERN